MADICPSNETLFAIAESITDLEQCTLLAIKLNIRPDKVRRLARSKFETMLVFDMLSEWAAERTKDATGRVLYKALQDARRPDLAERYAPSLLGPDEAERLVVSKLSSPQPQPQVQWNQLPKKLDVAPKKMTKRITVAEGKLRSSGVMGKREDFEYRLPAGVVEVYFSHEDVSTCVIPMGDGTGEAKMKQWDRERGIVRVHAWVNGALGGVNKITWIVTADVIVN